MNTNRIPTAILASFALAAAAPAAIIGTFVAAQDGVNSFKSSDGTSLFSSTTATTGLWHDRSAGVFNINGITPSGGYQGQNKTTPSVVNTHTEIVTTLELTPGQDYDIYMIFGVNSSASSGAQNIDAGFSTGSLTTLTEAGSTDTGERLVTGGGATWYAAERLIGTATADGLGKIKVYVDATLNAERSVYNGLSYVAVPEPSAITLLGFGGLALASRRRRA